MKKKNSTDRELPSGVCHLCEQSYNSYEHIGRQKTFASVEFPSPEQGKNHAYFFSVKISTKNRLKLTHAVSNLGS